MSAIHLYPPRMQCQSSAGQTHHQLHITTAYNLHTQRRVGANMSLVYQVVSHTSDLLKK